jgi:ribosomal-protein-alanine N-acetyltransferase
VLKDETSEYAKNRETDGLAITLDIFICDRKYLGEGLATQIIKEFLIARFSDISEVFIDPEQSNQRAVHVYQKTGFQIVGDFIASWHPVPHYIMRLNMKSLVANSLNIVTDRLLMRPFNDDDIEPFSQICANPKVMRYIGNGKPLNKEEVRTAVTNWIDLYEKQGYGLLALTLKENNQLIGFCGLLHQTVDEENFIELGYRLDEPFWGKGIATEAALAIKKYAFDQLQISTLISIINHKNEASKKVALKIGMTFMKQTYFKGILVDVFTLTRG